MTEDKLSKLIESIRNKGDEDVKVLQQKAQDIADTVWEEVQEAITANGYVPCEDCGAYGAVERLDSGIMRKFRMREWDGCETCGGARETRGRGFVKK